MSLATRCTACGTAFRVVQDQLKISEGWVRCGRCDTVFNAIEGLFDLHREAPADWDTQSAPLLDSGREGEPAASATRLEPAPAPSAAPIPAGSRPPAGEARADELADGPAEPQPDEGTPSTIDQLLADPTDARLFGPKKRTESARPAAVVQRDRLEFSDARFDSDLFEEPAPADDDAPGRAENAAAAQPLESSGRPDFVRRADRRARWQSGPARLALGAASLFALLALVVQAGNHYRDIVAAQWPGARPALAAWCTLAGCSVGAPRRIDDVLVESTTLSRAAGIDAFVLSVNLRNRSSLALAAPSIDLNLTDGNGRLLARRALAPRDFHAAEVMQPGAEAVLQLTLATGEARVAGYTVEIFYP